jgi:hypothetical protein
MDRESVKRALGLEPSKACAYQWNADSTALVVVPGKDLGPLERYALTLSSDAEAASDGAKLVAQAKLWCFTGADSTPPRVEAVRPAHFIEGTGTWMADEAALDAAAETLDDALISDAIAIDLSEDCDADSLEAAFKVEPSIGGVLERIGPGRFLFRPLERLKPGTRYALTITTDLKDLAGLALPSEWKARFACKTAWLGLEGAAFDGDAGLARSYSAADFNTGAFHPFDAVSVSGENGTTVISLSFSGGFANPAAKAAAISKVSFSRLFPSSTANPELAYALWSSDRDLSLHFVDVAESGDGASSTAAVRYYSLKISGGQGGLTASDGSYMEEDLELLLEEGHEAP